VDTANQPIRQTCPDQVLAGLVKAASETDQAMLMRGARSCEAGVRRIHIINGQTNGALIQELFTLDGIGTMITTEGYQQIRDAGIEDVAGILELIRPLEEKGTLVRRSREMLENEIDRFMVVERDNRIIACAALYPWPAAACAELACVVVDDAYRGRKLGDALLGHALDRAHSAHMERLFVLTTQSAHWFLERGFEQGHVNDLPIERQAMYNLQRQSAVYIRNISHAARQPESSTSQSTHH
jgi:amino-acid N-acetyltransferase